jgi:hypothetical protein
MPATMPNKLAGKHYKVYPQQAGLSIWQLIFYNEKLPGIFLYRNNIQMTKKAI